MLHTNINPYLKGEICNNSSRIYFQNEVDIYLIVHIIPQFFTDKECFTCPVPSVIIILSHSSIPSSMSNYLFIYRIGKRNHWNINRHEHKKYVSNQSK